MTTRIYNLQVGTSAKQLCGADPNRKALVVVNDGTDTVYILSAQPQTKNDGLPIYKQGSPYEDTFSHDNLWIIAESGTQDVRVMVVS